VRYTTDGSEPTTEAQRYDRPIRLTSTTTVKAKAYWPDGKTSRTGTWVFTRVEPNPAASVEVRESGLLVDIFEQDGSWRNLPDFEMLIPVESRTANQVGLSVVDRSELFGLRFRGYLNVPTTGVYGFFLSSDDGSRLAVDGTTVVENDGIHGDRRRSGFIALEAGLHAIEVVFFQGRGGVALSLRFEGPGIEEQEVPTELLRH
jgi:hypothetical protein